MQLGKNIDTIALLYVYQVNHMPRLPHETADPPASQSIAIFSDHAIRRLWHRGEWWFSVIDAVSALSGSTYANRYWSDLKRKLVQEAGSGQPYEKIVKLKLTAPDGKQRDTDCANTEFLLRIVQSIPSPRAEPFKRWLASVGYERIREIENPELASARARALYEAKGYPEAWIEKRLRSIAIRGELTGEWRARDVKEGREFAILTAEIARATFGVTPGAHQRIKGLEKIKTGNNLRDHMTDLELIFTMLGEASTSEIARRKDARGFPANRVTAKEGGAIAGDARKALEAKTGRSVVSASNHLALKAHGAAALSHLEEVVPVARIAAAKRPPAPRKRKTPSQS